MLNSRREFFAANPGDADVIPLDTFLTVGLDRSGAGVINVSLNGVLQFSASDGGQALSGSNILNFLEDGNRHVRGFVSLGHAQQRDGHFSNPDQYCAMTGSS